MDEERQRFLDEERERFLADLDYAMRELLRHTRRNLYTVEAILLKYDFTTNRMNRGHHFLSYDFFRGVRMMANGPRAYDRELPLINARSNLISMQHTRLFNRNRAFAHQLLSDVQRGTARMWPPRESDSTHGSDSTLESDAASTD